MYFSLIWPITDSFPVMGDGNTDTQTLKETLNIKGMKGKYLEEAANL